MSSPSEKTVSRLAPAWMKLRQPLRPPVCPSRRERPERSPDRGRWETLQTASTSLRSAFAGALPLRIFRHQRRHPLQPQTIQEIAEAFPGIPGLGELREQRGQRFRHVIFRNTVEQLPVQPRSFEIAADIEREVSRHAADQPDIAGIGPGAAVGAAGDADAQAFLRQTVARHDLGDAVDHRRADTLRLRQRQTAGRQGGAGHRPAVDRQQILGELDAVAAQRRLDRLAVAVLDIRQDQVLGRHQDQRRLEAADDLAQTRPQRDGIGILDAPAGDRQAQIPAAVALGMPAQMIDHLERRHRAGIFQGMAQLPLHLPLEPVEAALVDRVFQAGVPAVGPVAVVALDGHHGLDRRDQVVRLDEGDEARQPGICLRLVVRHAKTAADREIVAGKPVAARTAPRCPDRWSAHRPSYPPACQTYLEFARQICGTVERFGFRPRRFPASPRPARSHGRRGYAAEDGPICASRPPPAAR